LTGLLERLGSFSLNLFQRIGEIWLLFVRTIAYCRQVFANRRLVLLQMVEIGVNTVPLVAIMAFFTGMVIAVQTGYQAVRFHLEGMVGPIVGLSLTRELGPVMTGVIVAGRVGAAIAAQVGTMKVTEQIDALETLATDPVEYLVMPRFIAAIIMLPILTVCADVIGIAGGLIIAVTQLDRDANLFLTGTFRQMEVSDVVSGLIKSAFFGMIVAIIGCYQGLTTTGGAEGVGKSTTRAVVLSLMLILVSNFFLTVLILGGKP
jgi:phospholipid/cholesterol/gamma-HCH transport system permease protein